MIFLDLQQGYQHNLEVRPNATYDLVDAVTGEQIASGADAVMNLSWDDGERSWSPAAPALGLSKSTELSLRSGFKYFRVSDFGMHIERDLVELWTIHHTSRNFFVDTVENRSL